MFAKQGGKRKTFGEDHSTDFMMEQLLTQNELEDSNDMPPILCTVDYRQVLEHYETTGVIPDEVIDYDTLRVMRPYTAKDKAILEKWA